MRLFSCCGHNKYILSHENHKVRPHRCYVLKSHSGFLQLMQAGKDHTSTCWSPRRSCHRLQKVLDQTKENCKRPRKPVNLCESESPSQCYFVSLGPFFLVQTPSCLWLTQALICLRYLVISSHRLDNISCFGPLSLRQRNHILRARTLRNVTRQATGVQECARQHQPSSFNTQTLTSLSAASACLLFYLGLPYHQLVNAGMLKRTLHKTNIYNFTREL